MSNKHKQPLKTDIQTTLRIFLILFILAALPAASLAAKDGSPVIPGEYIVVLKEGANPAATAKRYGVGLRQTYGHALKGFSGTVPPGLLRALQNDPSVLYIEPDVVVTIASQYVPTGVSRIGAAAALNGLDQRVDVDVAILDTGIDLTHPDLNVVRGVTFIKDGSRGNDGHGHGTHVAGIVGALDNGFGVVGVAPGVRLWAVKVLDDWGYGSLSSVIAGVDYVTKNADRIAVANMSFSFRGTSDAFRAAIQRSVASGVVYVAAAGNSRADVYGGDGIFETGDDYIPAAYPEVMTVSALQDTDGMAGGVGPLKSWGADDTLATFSNFSRSVVADNPVLSPGGAIDVAAPGGHIVSTYRGGSYATLSGTSMAAPHAAGAVALLIAKSGRASNASEVAEIRQELIIASDSQQNWGPSFTRDEDGNKEGLVLAPSVAPGGSVPLICLLGPSAASSLRCGTPIDFEAVALDFIDGDVSATLSWWSSVEGELGQGGQFSRVLTEGTHLITVSASNGSAAIETTSFPVTILPATSGLQCAVMTHSPSYVNKQTVLITVKVGDGVSPVQGAAVNLGITFPNGKTSSGAGTTDSSGTIQFEHSVHSKKNGTGTYQIQVIATHDGYEPGAASTSFLVTK